MSSLFDDEPEVQAPAQEDVSYGVYRHYKGAEYRVAGFAKHTETGEELVIYAARNEKDPQIWCRPKKMWFDEVEHEGKKVKRFTLIEKSDY